MSLKTRVKKLERACGGKVGVIFFHVLRGGDLDYIIANVIGRSETISGDISEAIEECRRGHPGIEVRVQYWGDER